MALPTTPKEPNPGPSERRTHQHLNKLEQNLATRVLEVSRGFGSMQAALQQDLSSHHATLVATLDTQLNGVKSRNNRVRLVILFSLLLNLVSLAALGILLARVY